MPSSKGTRRARSRASTVARLQTRAVVLKLLCHFGVARVVDFAQQPHGLGHSGNAPRIVENHAAGEPIVGRSRRQQAPLRNLLAANFAHRAFSLHGDPIASVENGLQRRPGAAAEPLLVAGDPVVGGQRPEREAMIHQGRIRRPALPRIADRNGSARQPEVAQETAMPRESLAPFDARLVRLAVYQQPGRIVALKIDDALQHGATVTLQTPQIERRAARGPRNSGSNLRTNWATSSASTVSPCGDSRSARRFGPPSAAR